nr:DUF6371 domain-containing protein [Labilibaculum manganireducens]
MTDFRFVLDKSSKKYFCPACHKNSLVRYLDIETGNLMPEQYGRCDHEQSCRYQLTPYKDDKYKAESFIQKEIKPLKTYYIPIEVLKGTLKGYGQNTFITNLLKNIKYPFPVKMIEKVIGLYNLGTVTTGYMKGAITFPYIDRFGKVRAIQVKQFDQYNHTTGTDFIHSIIEKESATVPQWITDYNKNDLKVSCLFGEHLLKQYPNNPIALVEAPKTAIYGTLYFGLPKTDKDLIWLAVYNLSSLNAEKVKSLKDKRVILFPDLSADGHAFKLWSDKATEFNKRFLNANFIVSDLLEKNASKEARVKGYDLGDYLIEQDYREFLTTK